MSRAKRRWTHDSHNRNHVGQSLPDDQNETIKTERSNRDSHTRYLLSPTILPWTSKVQESS